MFIPTSVDLENRVNEENKTAGSVGERNIVLNNCVTCNNIASSIKPKCSYIMSDW